MRKSRSRMGALVENAGFFPKMSVEKNLEYYRIQCGIPGKDPVEAVLHTVKLFKKSQMREAVHGDEAALRPRPCPLRGA